MTPKQGMLLTATFSVLLACTSGCSTVRGENWVPVYEEPRHRLAFDNPQVMILDVNLPPGYVSLYHKHELDVLYVTISGTQVWAQPLGEQRSGADVPTGDLRFSSDNHPLPHIHRVGNVGQAPFHVIGVGVKEASGQKSDPISGDASGLDEVDANPVSTVYRIRLDPGAGTGTHTHNTAFTSVFLAGGKLRDAEGKVVDARAADYLWQPAGVTHRFENAGDAAIDIVEVVAH